MRFIVVVLSVIVALAVGSAPAQAEKRVALVIGNSHYSKVGALPNPGRDAGAMGELFRRIGFDRVDVRTDLGQAGLRKALREFSDAVRDADIAVVFYAGHGIEVAGSNYLVPVDAVLERDTDVEDEAVSLDRVNQMIEPARRLRLIIVDACRDNPFAPAMQRNATRSIGRGFARVDVQTPDTMIAFAARPGATAKDGDGANSPYTTALLRNLATPGLDIRLAMGRVRDEVLAETGRQQEPTLFTSLGGAEISLVPRADGQLAQQAALVPAKVPPAPLDSPRARAERGDAVAQNELGVMYRDGRDVARDDAQAASWFRKAADQGNADAQVNLARMYWNGAGVARDDILALSLFRKAADQGNADGWNGVGLAYNSGRGGVGESKAEALLWFRKAAAQGNARAQTNIGLAYHNGWGVPQDYGEAVAWYRKAADQGFAAAQFNLGSLYYAGKGVPQDYGQALAWFRKAADQGDANAQRALGVMYDNGKGMPQDYAQAAHWYRKAADQGNANAQNTLGILYQTGKGVPQDFGQAVAWYRKAADQGFA